MTFNHDCIKELSEADFTTYLTGTFCKILVPKSDSFSYYFIDGFENNGSGTFYANLYQKEKRNKFPVKSLVFDFTFPDYGYYNYKGEAIFYNQRTTRQSQKGINQHSHELSHPLRSQVESWYPSEIGRYSTLRGSFQWSADCLNEMFCKLDSRSVENRIGDVLKMKSLSTPLSLNFAVSIGVLGKFPTIWFRKHPVGNLLSPSKIAITNELFKQEAIDFFTHNEIRVV